ncbi:AraC family transcriptional regulator [Kordia zhangzhouensis]|uniref:AraC family transcriptional regulator n=1 Tax=Kordia zhangzhouensis TaxID=1620405 RepID=UPI0009E309E3|nr:AraC family transcriptional regulator [Kordia zhangzhouensis]
MFSTQQSPYIHKITLLFILISNLSILYAQSDSLALKSYEELDSLYLTYRYNNPKKANIYAIAANKMALKKGNKSQIAWSQYYIAQSFTNMAKYDLALEHIDESITTATELQDNSLLFNNHNLRGNILSEKENELEAIDEYSIAKKHSLKSGDPMHLIIVSSNIAYLKKIHKNLKEAVTIYKETLALLEKIDSSEKEFNEIVLLMNLADTYLRMKNTKEAEYFNNLALNKCSEAKYPHAYFPLLMNDAIIDFQKGNYNKTIISSERVRSYFLSVSNEDQLVTPYFYLGKSYYKQEKYEEAILALKKVNTIVNKKKINFPDLEEAKELLLLSYNATGKTNEVSETFTEYSELNKKNDSMDMEVISTIYEKHDKADLENKITILDLYGQEQKSRATLWYTVSAILVVSLFLFFFLYRKKQHQAKKHFQDLLQTIETLEQSQIESEPTKTIASVITDESVLEILEGLETFEKKEYYLRQDCTLSFVAKKLKTNTSYLSNVINTYKGKPFKSYLTELRINAALIRLKNDKKLRAYTIKAIAEEFGFKRQETFSKAFKAQTKMLPSYYIKSLSTNKLKN